MWVVGIEVDDGVGLHKRLLGYWRMEVVSVASGAS